MYLVVFALLSVVCPPPALGANILGVFSIPSISHQVVYRALTLELNKRGHNLTIITPDPVNDPNLTNYREIDVSFYYGSFRQQLLTKPKELRLGLAFPEFVYLLFTPVMCDLCHAYFSSPQVQALIKENPRFDLVIVEFGIIPCFYALAKFSDYKFMGIFSFQATVMAHSSLGNPIDASYLQEGFNWLLYGYTITAHTTIARKYLGDDIPPLWEIDRNLSALLVNTHFTMGEPRPNLPNIVEIGGPAFHLIGRKRKPLPEDIKAFLDDAPEGVVYFSLGTNVQTSNISSEEERILMESFGKIKQKVLWKWENEKLKVNSKNVMKRKWYPQWEILCHPNVKAFVTQAGLQSVGEAINCQVPLIVMPFFADQNHNARKMEQLGVALYLDFDSLDVGTFTGAVNEIVYNKKYKENMLKLSALVQDQPTPPLERAVWWTEYVIRHNGAPHLRSAAATMPWYQYMMLDVLAVLFLALFVILYVVYSILAISYRFLFKSGKPKTD